MHTRHGEMLAEVADMSMKLARKLHERAMAAETDEELQAAASAFHCISRSLRQTLALEARLERDRRRDVIEARRLASEDRREQVKARKKYVGDIGSRLVWTEAERSDVGQLLVDLKRWCDEEAFHEERFLQGPVEAVVERLKRDLGLASRSLPPSPPPCNGGGGSPRSGETEGALAACGLAPPPPPSAVPLPRVAGEEKADDDWWSTPQPDWQSSA